MSLSSVVDTGSGPVNLEVQISPSWPSFGGLRTLIIFGDSYSSVSLERRQLHSLKPSSAEPLGVPWPGYTFNEDNRPNWVGHLISKYLPGPKYDPENPAGDDFAASPVLVYDYATGGDTVVGVRSQIQSIYLPSLTRDDGPVISSNDSLFVIWFGINDCAYSSDPSPNMKALAEQLEQLYNTEPGARNFLFIDVPPMNRSPAYKGNGGSQSARNRFLRWNEALNATTKEFASKYPDSTILLYSSYVIFSAFLDKPEEYGFETSDTASAFSRIWFDQLHPTSKVHDILAKDLAAFLKGVVAKRE